jgi:hypothetical protein
MEETTSAARSTDTNTLKTNIHLYAPLDYKRGPLNSLVDAESKIDFGFHYHELGRLLVPAVMLVNYDKVPVVYIRYLCLCLLIHSGPSMRAHINAGKRPATAKHFPAFLYSNFDPEQLESTLLGGHLFKWVRDSRC